MCQCMCCDCLWMNWCGVCCGGFHEAFCFCSHWCCKPAELQQFDPECCHMCKFDGWGGNCFCSGGICCAPEAVKKWSHQCLCCDCWWINYCGVCCGGVHEAFCFCSYWCCKPIDLRQIDKECCHICAFDGWGGNCFFSGSICCAPEAVKAWSRQISSGRRGGEANYVAVDRPY